MIYETRTVSKNNFNFNVIDDKIFHTPDGYDFWNQYNTWEINTFKIFDKFLNKDACFLDIGAWVGATGMYGAQKSKHVFCVEPDPVAFDFLQKNMSLNNIENITLINKAFSYEDNLFLSEVNFLGSSMTRSSKKTNNNRVDTVALEDFIFENNFSLIKIDIEGHEAYCIPKMVDVLKETKIPVYISFHESFFENKSNTLKDLISMFNFYKNIVDDYLRPINLNKLDSFGSYLFFNYEN